MNIYAIYDHPLDYPNSYIARKWIVINSQGETRPTSETIVAQNIEIIRQHFSSLGLVNLGREPEDDPVIVEVWW